MSNLGSRIGDFKTPLSRREWLTLASAGVVGCSMSGWLERVAAETANNPQRRRACLLLWMSGGPSQMDTFDLKPGHVNGGPFRETQTTVPGLRISEHLPQLARQMDDLAIIRSMSTREGDHTRATYYLRTGYLPTGTIQYPTLGSLVSKELGSDETPLPNFVSIAPYRQLSRNAFNSGFLGPRYAPLIVGETINPFAPPNQNDNYESALRVQDLDLPQGVTQEQAAARVRILEEMQNDFVRSHPSITTRSHQTAYTRAVQMMRTSAASAFDLGSEPDRVRDQYGRNLFGQGCLLARRLVERGVPFVEVSLSQAPGTQGWDSHNNNFNTVRTLSQVLDPAWATLMKDLKARGLLDSTLIVWMGEFGRTPRINQGNGRDHYPQAWSTVLGGGGIRGGQAYGATSADGTQVVGDKPTSVPDFIATIASALGINPRKQNLSNISRPIRFADPDGRPIREVLA
ncbi:MAG: DUF1501 domain-containing protein [Gemmataceae bacterium]